MPDLLFYFGIDLLETVRGSGTPPSVVMACIHRLPDTSYTHALMQGGPEYFQWGQDRHLLADIFDALNFNTRATGHWKDNAPDIPFYERPHTKKAREEKKRTTVKDIWSRLMGVPSPGRR